MQILKKVTQALFMLSENSVTDFIQFTITYNFHDIGNANRV